MTEKRSSEFLDVKMEIFFPKTSFRNFGPRKFFPSLQTRRKVSDHAVGTSNLSNYRPSPWPTSLCGRRRAGLFWSVASARRRPPSRRPPKNIGSGGAAWGVKFSNFAYIFQKFAAKNFCRYMHVEQYYFCGCLA